MDLTTFIMTSTPLEVPDRPMWPLFLMFVGLFAALRFMGWLFERRERKERKARQQRLDAERKAREVFHGTEWY